VTWRLLHPPTLARFE